MFDLYVGKPYSHPSHPALKCSPQILVCAFGFRWSLHTAAAFCCSTSISHREPIETKSICLPASNNATGIHHLRSSMFTRNTTRSLVNQTVCACDGLIHDTCNLSHQEAWHMLLPALSHHYNIPSHVSVKKVYIIISKLILCKAVSTCISSCAKGMLNTIIIIRL